MLLHCKGICYGQAEYVRCQSERGTTDQIFVIATELRLEKHSFMYAYDRYTRFLWILFYYGCGVCVSVCLSQGVNVREKAKQLVTLLKDEERLREERIHALKTKEKMAQTSSGEFSKSTPPQLLSQEETHRSPRTFEKFLICFIVILISLAVQLQMCK